MRVFEMAWGTSADWAQGMAAQNVCRQRVPRAFTVDTAARSALKHVWILFDRLKLGLQLCWAGASQLKPTFLRPSHNFYKYLGKTVIRIIKYSDMKNNIINKHLIAFTFTYLTIFNQDLKMTTPIADHFQLDDFGDVS